MPKSGRPRAEVVVTDDERAALVRLTKCVRVNRAVAALTSLVLTQAGAQSPSSRSNSRW